MKKLLFTFIAVTSFSGVAMASSSEISVIDFKIDKVELISNIDGMVLCDVAVKEPCYDKAMAVVIAFDSDDDVANHELYLWVLAHC